jgi:hypothetical protein
MTVWQLNRNTRAIYKINTPAQLEGLKGDMMNLNTDQVCSTGLGSDSASVSDCQSAGNGIMQTGLKSVVKAIYYYVIVNL